jgi:hypothetical protein
VAEPDPLFFPPGEILEAIAKQVDPAAGTSGLLLAGLERLMTPSTCKPTVLHLGCALKGSRGLEPISLHHEVAF